MAVLQTFNNKSVYTSQFKCQIQYPPTRQPKYFKVKTSTTVLIMTTLVATNNFLMPLFSELYIQVCNAFIDFLTRNDDYPLGSVS